MIERALIGLAAAAAVVVFALWAHSAALEDSAMKTATIPPALLSRAQVQGAVSQFERARAHNPDTRPIVQEAALLARRGRTRDAIALLQPVARKEPQNLTAWVLLSIAAQPGSALANQARARALRLNPPVAPSR